MDGSGIMLLTSTRESERLMGSNTPTLSSPAYGVKMTSPLLAVAAPLNLWPVPRWLMLTVEKVRLNGSNNPTSSSLP
eukprot:3440235-Prymnesium_polylepis.2